MLSGNQNNLFNCDPVKRHYFEYLTVEEECSHLTDGFCQSSELWVRLLSESK